MERILGKRIGVYEDGNLIGLSTNCALDIECDMVEVAAGDSRGKAYRAGRYSWRVSVEALLGTNQWMIESLADSLMYGNLLSIAFGMGGVDESINYTGNAYVTSLSMNAPVDGYVSCSVTLQGCGELMI